MTHALPIGTPHFWPAVWALVDVEFEEHKDAVKDWPLMWEVPMWNGAFMLWGKK